jgi:hypothetical protein
MGWMAGHRNAVVGALVAIAAVALAAWGISSWKESREKKAGIALADALALEGRPIAGEGAQPGEETFPSADARKKAVVDALEKVRAEHGGTTAAQTATAELGFEKLRTGDAAAAQKDLESFLDHAGGDHPLRAFATESLGYALEAQGKLDEARKAFAKLADVGMQDRAAFQEARLALVEGKPDAKQQLEQVAKDYAKEPVSMEANQRLEIAALPKAEPQAATPAPAPATKTAKASKKK